MSTVFSNSPETNLMYLQSNCKWPVRLQSKLPSSSKLQRWPTCLKTANSHNLNRLSTQISCVFFSNHRIPKEQSHLSVYIVTRLLIILWKLIKVDQQIACTWRKQRGISDQKCSIQYVNLGEIHLNCVNYWAYLALKQTLD